MPESSFDQFTTYALIDLDALGANVRAIKTHIGQACTLIAVVKANAYGHGAIPVARAALSAGASMLAVARVDEGIALRKAGIGVPILLLGYTVPGESHAIIEHDLTAAVAGIDAARALSERAQALGRTMTIHLKIDTGMGRFGLLPEETIPAMRAISSLPGLDIEGIYTHFATADSGDKTFTFQQYTTFTNVLNSLGEAGYTFRMRHAANSAATLDLPTMHLDAVRIGIAMYGLRPSSEVEPSIALKPVLSLKSHVARLRILPGGSSVGYGRTFIAQGPTQVALIPIGYGDGYHRALSNRGITLISGKRVPVIGRVSMDQITVDATGVSGINEGDEAVLIGAQGGEHITAEEIAGLADTINYEVTTSLLPRVPRIYLRGGEIMEILLEN